MKYFKVLGPHLTSFNFQNLEHKYSLQYSVGRWTFADKGSPLFIFDTLENSIDYAGHMTSDVRIFECEVEGLVHNPVNTVLSNGNWPKGTLFAYGVKITNEVIPNKKLENFDIVKFRDEQQYVQLDGDYVVIRNSNGYQKDKRLHKNIVWSDATHFKFTDGIVQYEWTGKKAKLVVEFPDDN